MSTADRVSRLQNPTPANLRHAATIPGMIWLPIMACAGPLVADALEIADESSEALIVSSCIQADRTPGRWFDTRAVAAEDKAPIQQAVRYLEARGLLARDDKQPHLVRLTTEASV